MIQRPNSRQPIPNDARRVFKGRVFDVYQWEQLLFNGSTTTFEKVRRPDTAYILPVTDSGRVLIVRQEQPGSQEVFGLIGGRVEDGEGPDEAARRELLEEAGLVPTHLDLWDSYQFLPKMEWAIYTFITREYRSVHSSFDGGEKIKLAEVTFDDLIKLAGSEEFGDVEVALRLLRLAANPGKLAHARRFIFGDPIQT